MKKVKLLVVGDPHGSEKLLKLDTKGYDAAIITGDMGKSDVMRELAWGKKHATKKSVLISYLDYVNSALSVLKHLSGCIPVFCVHGNAELSDEDINRVNKDLKCNIPLFERKLEGMKNVLFIDNMIARFKGIKIAGIGHFLERRWLKEFSDERIDRVLLAAIEEEITRLFFNKLGKVDILLSHQPPFGILDKVGSQAPKGWSGKHAGSVLLLDYIKKNHPKYVICGHIHEAKGRAKIGKTTVINAGCCGDWQSLVFKK